jgi:hypothetical protein
MNFKKKLENILAQPHSLLRKIASSKSHRYASENFLSLLTADTASALTSINTSTSTLIQDPFTPTLILIELGGPLSSLHVTMPSATQPTQPTTLLVNNNVINLRLLQMYCKRY